MLKYPDDIIITYTWEYEHGLCGHTYEAIEYFYILSKFFNCKILLVNFDKNYFRKIIERKYIFTKKEIDFILSNTIFISKEDIKDKKIFAKSVLVLDGFYYENQNKQFITPNLVCFACYHRRPIDLKINCTILQDYRIYPIADNTINYTKKILLDKLKKPKNIKREKPISLLYLTKSSRFIDVRKYNPEEVICLTDGEKIQGYKYIDMPVDNIFEHFDKYIYTPVKQKFDCSSRFIVECKYFNKEVIYDIDYIDIGLEVRKKDLNNLDNLKLTENDYIVEFFRKIYE